MVSALAGNGTNETKRWTDRLFGNTWIRFAVWVLALGHVFPGLFTDSWKLADWMDDHQFFSWETSDRATLVKWLQIPMWNPYWCGGTAGASAPEDPFFGPDFWLRIIFDVEHGRRIALGLLIVMGMEGTYRLARALDSNMIGAIVAAVVYASSDKFIGFIHDGWVNFLGFELIPWVCLCFFKGFTSHNWRLLGGFFIAWILMSAGTYPTPFTLLTLTYLFFVFFFRGLLSKERKRALLPVKSLFFLGIVSIGLCLVKLVPMVLFLKQFPRVFTPIETNQALTLVTPFWDRYGLVCVLAFIALGFADRIAGIFFLGAILFLACACGDFGPYSPFHLLKSLPVFGQLRIPDRYMVLVLFFTCIAASRGVTRVQDAASRIFEGTWNLIGRRVGFFREYRVVAAATFLGLTTMVVAHYTYDPTLDILATVTIHPGGMYVLEPPRVYDGPFHQSRGNRRDAHVFTTANLGSMYCVAGNPVPESPLLRGDLQQEEYAEDPDAATVKEISWSPQAIDLEVDAKKSTTIRVNQNYSPHWKSDVGEVRNEEMLFVIDVPAGKNVVHLRYRDYTTYVCLAVSLATLLALTRRAAKYGWSRARELRANWREIPLWPWTPKNPPKPSAAASKTDAIS